MGYLAREQQEQVRIQADVKKAEQKFISDGFDKFYEQRDNKFCVKTENAQEQEDLARDMAWVLNNQNIKQVKIIECANGGKGIEVK